MAVERTRALAIVFLSAGVNRDPAANACWPIAVFDVLVAVNDQSAISGNSDLGSQVRVFGGSFNNAPIYHYLMKKPEWLCKIHDAEREKYHDQIEAQLRRGAYNRKAEDRQYTGDEMPGSSLPPISITHGA